MTTQNRSLPRITYPDYFLPVEALPQTDTKSISTPQYGSANPIILSWVARLESGTALELEEHPDETCPLPEDWFVHRLTPQALKEQDATLQEVFDLVLCHGLHQQVDDPFAGAALLMTMLKPGGWLILTSIDFGPVLGSSTFIPVVSGIRRLFSLASLHRFCQDMGFEVWDSATRPAAPLGVAVLLCRKPGISPQARYLLPLPTLVTGLAYRQNEKLKKALAALTSCLSKGGRIIALGNGPDAALANCLAATLGGRPSKHRPLLPAISLSADPVTLTAVAGEYGLAQAYSRLLSTQGRPGDLVVIISTRRGCRDVLLAVEMSLKRRMPVLVLSARYGLPTLEEGIINIRTDTDDPDLSRVVLLGVISALCHGVDTWWAAQMDTHTP